jgi:CxxC-x17-CxxC domain-containing protein
MNLTDKYLTCVECGAAFVFGVGEQLFFARKGFAAEPRRCPICRAVRRLNRAANQTTDQSTPPPEHAADVRPWFTAVCDACGQETQVPFRPDGDRRVYCANCFRAWRAHGQLRR